MTSTFAGVHQAPGTGQLEPFLDHMAVGAFDFPRANRQPFFEGALVIQLGQAVEKVAVAVGHGAFVTGFQAVCQRFQRGIGPVGLEPVLLGFQPGFGIVGGTGLGAGGQN